MQIVTWLKTNIWKVSTAVLILLLLLMYRSSMQKDFTHEKALMEIKFRDEKNIELQKLREELNQAKDQKDDAIRAKEIQDSLVQANTYILDRSIRALQTEKNNYEKYKPFDNYGSDELRNYYSKLPKHNDY
jgi:preprotein translocase subunit SecF